MCLCYWLRPAGPMTSSSGKKKNLQNRVDKTGFSVLKQNKTKQKDGESVWNIFLKKESKKKVDSVMKASKVPLLLFSVKFRLRRFSKAYP